MELVQGKSLARAPRRGLRPTAGELPGVIAQVLEALDYSHGRGVIHRDIKARQRAAERDGRGQDLGLRHRAPRALARAAGRRGGGHAYYMAPEQFEGREADARNRHLSPPA